MRTLLRVSAAGICGSDIHGFLGHSARRRPGLVMGHETVASIREIHPSALPSATPVRAPDRASPSGLRNERPVG